MGISTVAGAADGVFTAWIRFSRNPELGEPVGFGKWMLANKWYVDEIYDALIVKPLNALGEFLQQYHGKESDRRMVNGTGQTGAVWQPADCAICRAARWADMCC